MTPRAARSGVVAMLAVAGWLAAPATARAVAPPDTLSLERVIALARERSPDVRPALAAVRAAREDSAAASFNRLPQLSLKGGAMLPYRYDPVITNLGEYHAQFGVDLPLADAGQRGRERRRAALAARAALEDLAQSSRDSGVHAAQSALETLHQQETVLAQQEALMWVDRMTSLVSAGVRGGARPRADAARLEIERDDLAATVLETLEARDAAARELAEWLGRAPEEAPAVATPDSADETGPSPDDSVRVLAAAERRPDVRRAEVDWQQTAVDLDQARRRNGWQVGLSADAGLAGSDLTHAIPPDVAFEHPNATLADRLRRDAGASVSVDLKRPVFDPSVSHGVAAREAAREAAALRLVAARARGRRDALDLLGKWRAGAARVARERSGVGRAEQHLLRMRSLYAGGDAPLLDLLDARRQVEDAREKLADARFELRLARVVARELP